MKCSRCHRARAMKGKDLCGICEIIDAQERGEAFRWGVQSDGLVPRHWNAGLGEEIEGYDHLKKRRKELKRQGKISAWD